MKKYALFLLSVAAPAFAGYSETNDCCEQRTKKFDVLVHAGLEPIEWSKRGGIIGEVNRSGTPTYVLGQCIPKFSTLFHVPWVVGGQAAYTWRDCLRMYLEVNYVQARPRTPCKTTILTFASSGAPAGSTSTFYLNTYRFWDAYVGSRYYIGYVCSLRFFIGSKTGIIRHKQSNFGFSQTTNNTPPVTTTIIEPCSNTPFIKSGTRLAGGLSFGFEYEGCNNWYLGVTANVLVNKGPTTNCYIPITGKNATTGFLLGKIKTEIRYPITATLRHSF